MRSLRLSITLLAGLLVSACMIGTVEHTGPTAEEKRLQERYTKLEASHTQLMKEHKKLLRDTIGYRALQSVALREDHYALSGAAAVAKEAYKGCADGVIQKVFDLKHKTYGSPILLPNDIAEMARQECEVKRNIFRQEVKRLDKPEAIKRRITSNAFYETYRYVESTFQDLEQKRRIELGKKALKAYR